MAESHPAQFDEYSQSSYASWADNKITSYVLLACLILLSVVLNRQYSSHWSIPVSDRLMSWQLPLTEPALPAPPVIEPNVGKYRAIGEYLARRYSVSSEVTTNIVAQAHTIGKEFKVDPMLILAVISIESRFNPIAESTMGAKGLMQIIPRYHPEKFNPLGGEKAAFEPAANMMVGAKILKDYLRRTGDLGDALQMYVGATTEENENGYSAKVMTERDRLVQVLHKYQTRDAAAARQSAVKRVGSAT